MNTTPFQAFWATVIQKAEDSTNLKFGYKGNRVRLMGSDGVWRDAYHCAGCNAEFQDKDRVFWNRFRNMVFCEDCTGDE